MYEGSLVDRYDEQSGYTHSGNWDIATTTLKKVQPSNISEKLTTGVEIVQIKMQMCKLKCVYIIYT